MSDINIVTACKLIIFAKAPIPGHAKTRLIPALGKQGAAELHKRLLIRCVENCLESNLGHTEIHFSEAHPFFQSLMRRYPLSLSPQSQGDLGARMYNALHANSSTQCLLMGSDCPAITAKHLQQSSTALNHHDLSFLPAEDGGFGLVGVKKGGVEKLEFVFQGTNWGTETVMEQTRIKLISSALSWAEPASIWDVDEPADLIRLKDLSLGID